jgi:hypothetical protein
MRKNSTYYTNPSMERFFICVKLPITIVKMQTMSTIQIKKVFLQIAILSSKCGCCKFDTSEIMTKVQKINLT